LRVCPSFPTRRSSELCDGQLWVRVISATPVYQGNSNCAVGMDVTYAVGIVRCVTALDDRGRAPKDTKVTKDGMRTIEDMCTLHTDRKSTRLNSSHVSI